jgi:hypothetical protein
MFDELNIYNMIGILIICIIGYIILGCYMNDQKINIESLNNKFESNKKLNKLKYNNINVKENDKKIILSKLKIIKYLNKYLTKKYKREYILKEKSVVDVTMGYNQDYKLYRIGYKMELDIINVDIVLYLDEKNEIYVDYISSIDDMDLDIDIDNELDLLVLFNEPEKLYEISDKLRTMKEKGYKIEVVDMEGGKEKDKKKDSQETTQANNSQIVEGIDLGNFKTWENENSPNIISQVPELNRSTFLNGDNICEGCIDNSVIINCDIKKDSQSSYALF